MKEQDYELIHRFIDNEDLTEDEINLFKDKYTNDPDFKNEVILLTEAEISLRATGKMKIPELNKALAEEAHVKIIKPKFWKNLKKLSKTLAETFPGTINMPALQKNLRLLSYNAAASIVIFLCAGMGLRYAILTPQVLNQGGLLVSPQGEQTSNFSDLLKKIDSDKQAWIETLNEGEKFEFAFYCQKNKRYSEAIYTFERYIEKINSTSKAYYICEYNLGLCYYENGQPDKAKAILTKIANDDKNPLKKESRKELRRERFIRFLLRR
jgi:tetratricopeptide (TPR) repeat protein